MITQNKKLVSIWHESKKHFDSSLELDCQSSEGIQDFLNGILKIVQRWTKVQAEEEADLVSCFIVEELMNSMIIKMDNIHAENSKFKQES